MKKVSLLILITVAFCLNTLQADKKKKTKAKRKPDPISVRGKDFWLKAPWIGVKLIYQVKAETPDKQGLGFGGLSQLDWNPDPGTFIKKGDAWVNISAELKKKNKLQPHSDEVLKIRTNYKDALAGFRHLYFEGGSNTEENKSLLEESVKKINETKTQLETLISQLKKQEKTTEYEKSQSAIALSLLEKTKGSFSVNKDNITAIKLKEMWQAVLAFEAASESLNAEPLPRVYHALAYDQKSKLFVLFGGDHFDYLLNDLWVFDLSKLEWQQRHLKNAPEPRAKPHYKIEDGILSIEGGFTYKYKSYNYGSRVTVHVGPGKWLYDIAKNSWTGATELKPFASNSRVYRLAKNKQSPDYYIDKGVADASANENKLKNLPANTWVKMKGRSFSIGHDWGTVAYDPYRDILMHWGGGHSANPGGEVMHYHPSTNRWEMTWPLEWPVAHLGSTTIYPRGVNYNHRPGITMHAYHGYAYDPISRLMTLIVRVQSWKGVVDPNYYLYDTKTAEWTAQHKKHRVLNAANAAPTADLRSHGKEMLSWIGTTLLTLDRKNNKWVDLKIKGLPRTATDGVGSCYDSKRDVALLASATVKGKGWKRRYSGQIWAVDMKTKAMKTLSPKGMKSVKPTVLLREAIYHKKSDLVVWASIGKDLMLIYDPAENQWLKTTLLKQPNYGTSTGVIYDEKRNLIWLVNNRGEVFVLKFERKSLKLLPLE